VKLRMETERQPPADISISLDTKSYDDDDDD